MHVNLVYVYRITTTFCEVADIADSLHNAYGSESLLDTVESVNAIAVLSFQAAYYLATKANAHPTTLKRFQTAQILCRRTSLVFKLMPFLERCYDYINIRTLLDADGEPSSVTKEWIVINSLSLLGLIGKPSSDKRSLLFFMACSTSRVITKIFIENSFINRSLPLLFREGELAKVNTTKRDWDEYRSIYKSQESELRQRINTFWEHVPYSGEGFFVNEFMDLGQRLNTLQSKRAQLEELQKLREALHQRKIELGLA